MAASIRDGVIAIYQALAEHTVIGLTGRTGSGCTTAATILSQANFNDLRADAALAEEAEQRKQKLILALSAKIWEPFLHISASTAIITFLFDELTSPSAHLEQLWGPKQADRAHQAGEQIANITAGIQAQWKSHEAVLSGEIRTAEESISFMEFWKGPVQKVAREVRQLLGADISRTLQAWGDNLRSSGSLYDETFSAKHMFSLQRRVLQIADVHRALQSTRGRPSRIVVDAIRNPLEIQFFRNQCPRFFTLGVTADDEDRRHRLAIAGYTSVGIDALDQKEYPQQNKMLGGEKQLVSQNIQACLEKADVFIRNNGRSVGDQAADLRQLTYQLLRYTTLAEHPGLVTPSRDERCMQLAFVARASSGCISRQVGAVVTDAAYSVQAVGWNDVAKGQISCLLRDVDDLSRQREESAFSAYEFSNKDFRTQVSKSYANTAKLASDGLSCPFCFKDEFNTLKKDKNQVHTRSLHAEENAFLQIAKTGGMSLAGGVLYTTASPCELCAKKAYQLGIKRVVYVDPYPGISNDHIFASGDLARRPKVELFSGAVGAAYHRFFDPVLSIKDERKARLQDLPDKTHGKTLLPPEKLQN